MYYTTVTTTPLSRPQVKINLSDLSNCGVITTSSLITFIQSLLVVLDEEHSTQMRKEHSKIQCSSKFMFSVKPLKSKNRDDVDLDGSNLKKRVPIEIRTLKPKMEHVVLLES